MTETKHLQHAITSGHVWVVVNETSHVPAFWAHPQMGGPFPGLVLLHDDWGMGTHMRDRVHRFAEIGYYVIAPDLFEGHRANAQIEADALEFRYKSIAPPKVTAALQALETHRKCNRKMAVIGWDLGAELAMQVALYQTDIMAAVAFYGDPSSYLGHLHDLKCPLMVINGSEDELTARTELQLRAELEADNKPHEVLTYPGALHGFFNDMTPMYKPDAAEDAWFRILSFLETYQGKPPAPDMSGQNFWSGRVY
jgi:carboxymethylenebutenolidase